ncbi:MAG: RecQ family ATP-dependent DNA helicase, partial [bacterium]
QWGHDFRPDYAELSLLRRERPDVPLALLTATATPQVVSDITRQIGLRDPEIHVHGFYRPNLYIQVADCRNEGHKLAVLRQALRKTPEGRVIVYCGTRKGCEEVAMALSTEFPGTTYYHAGMDPVERQRIQVAYDRGQVRILVATNAFGMGIDHPDVRLVVHHQMPANLEAYYQEIGRAGRDGLPSTCLLLYARKDKGLQSYFIRESDAPPQVIHHRWNTLNAMIQYAEGGGCRHGGILTYFRDTQRISACGHCDTCAPEASGALEPAALLEPATSTMKRTRKRRATAGEAGSDPVTDPVQLRRMEVLRDWRKGYAKQNDVPAFVVFSDKTLRELTLKNPRGPKELLEVYGIGEHKVDAFGEAVLKVLQSVETP